MTEPGHASAPISRPPPAPPLPPARAGGVFQKFIAPLAFNIGARPNTTQTSQSTSVSPSTTTNNNRISRSPQSQTKWHRTGIPIAAVDTNRAKTHAIVAGHEILRTIQVQDGRIAEDLNLRSSINAYASSHSTRPEVANLRRDYLPAYDVVWSKGSGYDTIIATAANNGRIALYDVSRINRSRVELQWLHEHTGQINKLDFDPTGGYLLLSGSSDKTVRVWDIRDPKSVKKRSTFNIRQPVRDVRWSPTDPGEFALCTENGVVQRWDLRQPSGPVLSINNAHEKPCYAIDWHPDGRHLVSGGFDQKVRVWDMKSENRRQKPAFELRAPQEVLCVRWRPPCWSSDLAEKGHWQSAQLATSYTDDDPRIHIWDLRRPFLPFREIDRYSKGATDIVWASEHFLWSVGTEGMFTQNDVRYAPLVQDELSTSAIDFMPDGSFVAFSEDIRPRGRSAIDDAAAGFLRIPQERLSGGTDGGLSRSFSDDDDGEDGLLATSLRRHKSRSLRSAKSQGNTPPATDGFSNIVPLDRSVLSRSGTFNNDQVGTMSNVTGVSENHEVVAFLAQNYALPMTAEERKRNPAQVLGNLEAAFVQNANACDYASMHRMAQSWRILSAVVVSELRDWADTNRKLRLEAEAVRRISPAAFHPPARAPQSHAHLSRTKIMNNLFRGVAESEINGSDHESTSNMTTPTAKPLPDSPVSPRRHESTFLSLNEVIEPMQPLPPSVLSSHFTATAASEALLNATSEESSGSSPEAPRRPIRPIAQHKRHMTDVPKASLKGPLRLQSPNVSTAKPISGPLIPTSPRMELRKQEDRRAAIRDFRAQQRQLFTLDEPIKSPRHATNVRHDSSESFPMFSASTDSSHRARSLGQSIDFPKEGRRQQALEEWHTIKTEDARESPLVSITHEALFGQSSGSQDLNSEDDSMHEDFPMDETSRVDFVQPSAAEAISKPVRPKPSAAASMWDIGELCAPGNSSQSDTVASSASNGGLQFEEGTNVRKPLIYTSNPIRKIVSRAETVTDDDVGMPRTPIEEEHADSKEYIINDFRRIDFTTYEPKVFAWSALPLICHTIAFDVAEGIASAQFSVHLLMYLHPFFFGPALQVKVQPGIPPPDSLAERLMRPDLSHRTIETLLLSHYLYLKRVQLYRPMTELRNTCVDLGLDHIFQTPTPDYYVGASLKQDPYQIQVSCGNCSSFMHVGAVTCQNCGQARDGCPICLRMDTAHETHIHQTLIEDVQLQSAWTFCQACGHSAHWTCMQEWMLQLDAGGECPTRGCGCDCGPGPTRQARIARQLVEAEIPELIRGSRASGITKRDPHRASHSPAVDKTRDSLRNSDAVAKDSTGDDRSWKSFGDRAGGGGAGSSRGGPSGGGSALSGMSGVGGSVSTSGGNTARGPGQSFGRRVRLVTPGEQDT